MAIKKNNAKDKNHRLDAFLYSLWMPFEDLFSKMSHRARYRGTLKVHFQALMEAMVSNSKRLIFIGAQPVQISWLCSQGEVRPKNKNFKLADLPVPQK